VTPATGVYPAPYQTMVGAAPPPPYYQQQRKSPRRIWLWVIFGLLFAAIAAGAFLVANDKAKVAVPGAIGSPQDQGGTLHEERGFQVNVDRQRSLQPVDQVIAQDPGAGTKAKKGSTVTLTVSDGKPDAVVPAVEGLPLKVAVKKMQKQGFVVDINSDS